MPDLVQTEQEWTRRVSYDNDFFAGGDYFASDVYKAWQEKTLTFEDFVAQDTDLTSEQTEYLLGNGKSMPRTTSNELHRYKHPKGYSFFRKDCPVVREEYLLSHFAAAVGFPYAPILPNKKLTQVYTPKLGEHLNSLYNLLINRLKKSDINIPENFHSSFNHMKNEFGSASKIPCIQFLSPLREEYDWDAKYLKDNKVFMSKLCALKSFMGAEDSIENPTNLICDVKTGRFVYAIDQAPMRINLMSEFDIGAQPIQLREYIDRDVVENMQSLIKEHITDELIDKMISRIRLMTHRRDMLLGGEVNLKAFDFWEQKINQYSDSLKHRRDNLAPLRS